MTSRYIPQSIKDSLFWSCPHDDQPPEYHHVMLFSLLKTHKYLVKLCHACHRKNQFVKPKPLHLDEDMPCFCDACQAPLRNDRYNYTYKYENLGYQFYICRKCYVQWESSIDYYRENLNKYGRRK
jgi:hypothetical protein